MEHVHAGGCPAERHHTTVLLHAAVWFGHTGQWCGGCSTCRQWRSCKVPLTESVAVEGKPCTGCV
jgi:hypothetical protein